MALELLVIFPLVIVLLTLVVGLGRYSHGRQVLVDASAAAARAASLASTPGQAGSDATQMALTTLDEGDLTCRPRTVNVDVHDFGPGGHVSVTIRCTAPLSALAMAGLPDAVHLSSTSTSPLDTYRSFAGQP